ncbi:MAG: cytochrome c3 family protein, partial [Nitrospirota bacterium]|nr:cytochrome c3 family protein [Nitrospirota bacterium]
MTAIVFAWSGSSATAQVKLKADVPALCYECHKELKKNLADQYTHFLFKQGKCTTCHNSHVSNVKGLMNDEVNTICLNCHEKLKDL